MHIIVYGHRSASEGDVSQVADVTDMQVARNMQNFAPLKAIGQTKKPVLQASRAATVEEWLMAGEISTGPEPHTLCFVSEVKGYDPKTRTSRPRCGGFWPTIVESQWWSILLATGRRD